MPFFCRTANDLHPDTLESIDAVKGHTSTMIISGSTLNDVGRDQYVNTVNLNVYMISADTIVKDIGDGLNYSRVCDPPIIHGDLRSNNILIDEEVAVLPELGLSFIVDNSDFTLAKTAGACRWTAPEIMNLPEDAGFDTWDNEGSSLNTLVEDHVGYIAGGKYGLTKDRVVLTEDPGPEVDSDFSFYAHNYDDTDWMEELAPDMKRYPPLFGYRIQMFVSKTRVAIGSHIRKVM
ncbi:hypothetical protein BDQ17DRAFT_1326683 [Cyathus striatus]|nr:hypothetical protein BDQ17DRAFT_1326683 [Cyathus striatus]